MFGNLRAELLDAAPELSRAATSRFSAGPMELQETLRAAMDHQLKVILIIDGLDHIGRVRGLTPEPSAHETDIVGRISEIEVPPGVGVILGSQPGVHLDAIRSAWGGQVEEVVTPPWSRPELDRLLLKMGVPDVLAASYILDPDVARILDLIHERSTGNPLYATYLARMVVRGIAAAPERRLPLDGIRDTAPRWGHNQLLPAPVFAARRSRCRR